jgi:hypothetical protein
LQGFSELRSIDKGWHEAIEGIVEIMPAWKVKVVVDDDLAETVPGSRIRGVQRLVFVKVLRRWPARI